MTPDPVLIDAYEAWDRWAQQTSDQAAAAIAQGRRPPQPSARSGEAITRRLIDAEEEAGALLGISGRRLHMRIVKCRQAGLTIAEAINRALQLP